MELLLLNTNIYTLLSVLAIISAIFVISTQNPIYSVLNLIVLYILVAFYLMFKGITYIGLSYIIIYVGAIAILFLFILMMIDLEIVEKRNNNYLPLLCLLLVGSVFLLKNIVVKYGFTKGDNLGYESLDKFQSIYDLDLELFELENLDVYYDLNGNPILDIDIQDYIGNIPPYPDLSPENPVYPLITKIYLELWIDLMREVLSLFGDVNRTRSFEEILSNNSPWLNGLMNNNIEIIDNFKLDTINNSNYLNNNVEYEWYPDPDIFSEFNLPYGSDVHFKIKDIYEDVFVPLSNTDEVIDRGMQNNESWISNGISVINNIFNNDNEYYMLFVPDWENVVNRVTQISAIGDILYSVYHSYIYIYWV